MLMETEDIIETWQTLFFSGDRNFKTQKVDVGVCVCVCVILKHNEGLFSHRGDVAN